MSSYRVRVAQAHDDVAIGALLVSAFVEQYARKMPDVVVTEARKTELRDVAAKRAAAIVWVVETNGEVVGTVALWPPGAHRSEAWISNAADLRHLAVAKAHRGGAVSKLLVDAAENYAREHGYLAVCLHARRGADGVRALYEKRGYVRAPEGDLDQLPDIFLEALVLRF